MSKKSRRAHKAKQREKRKQEKLNAAKIATQQVESAPQNRTVRDLPLSSKFALAMCFVLKFLPTVKADNLHNGWTGALFATNDANAINFGIQFDPDTFPDVNQVTQQLLNQCGNLITLVSPDWWNDVSIDWQSLYSVCNNGIYKTQAQAYMTLSQYVLDQVEDISIPDSVWQCVNQTLSPSCQTSFFTDWAGIYKALAIIGLAVGACCVTGISYGAIKYLTSIWSQRSGYDQIPDRQAPAAINTEVDLEANNNNAAASATMRVD